MLVLFSDSQLLLSVFSSLRDLPPRILKGSHRLHQVTAPPQKTPV